MAFHCASSCLPIAHSRKPRHVRTVCFPMDGWTAPAPVTRWRMSWLQAPQSAVSCVYFKHIRVTARLRLGFKFHTKNCVFLLVRNMWLSMNACASVCSGRARTFWRHDAKVELWQQISRDAALLDKLKQNAAEFPSRLSHAFGHVRDELGLHLCDRLALSGYRINHRP